MEVVGRNYHQTPEKLVHELAGHLRNHIVWDSLLVSFPPLLVAIYLAAFLYRAAWIGTITFFLIILTAVGLGLLAMLFRYRPSLPSMGSAARLVDERAGAKDHFLTLATIEPSQSAPFLISRLRTDAAGYENHVELKRDFPYQIKRSFYGSLVGSIAVGLLFQLLFQLVHSTPPVPAPQRLREIAEKMAQRPRLSELGRGLQTLATKLEDPKASPQEKRAEIQETQKKIEEQQKKEQQKDDQDLLGQASSTLQDLEQQSRNGQDQQKEQHEGGGGSIQSNLPQEGQGESKQSQGNGGDSKDGLKDARLSKNMEQGKSAQGAPQDQNKENNQQKSGDEKGNQPDANKPERNQGKEAAGKTEGGMAESGGKSKASEEIPQGSPPAERFNKEGQEGKAGIKGAGYVTVQLPEEITADGKGESTGTKAGRNGRSQSKLPVSNVPLPAHIPDAPAEKQPMPLEYRGMIR
jgi:hypothetical protein